MRIKNLTWGLGAGFIVLITFLIYSPVLKAGFFWDDYLWFKDYGQYHSLTGFKIYWTNFRLFPAFFPFTLTTFWLEHFLWHSHWAGYHLTNVLLHSANALMIWFLLTRWKVSGAWFVAFLFAIHPVHVETVAWMTERKNLLSLFFYLGALAAFIEWRKYGLSFILFLCAVLSKPVACTFPVALLIVSWWRGGLNKNQLKILAPFFMVSVAMGMVTRGIEKTYDRVNWPTLSFSFLERCFLAARAFWFYLVKLILPTNLSIVYPPWSLDPSQFLNDFSVLAVLGLFLGLWLARNRIDKAVTAAALFFGVNLSLTLGFFPMAIYRFFYVADRWQYHASIGILALVSGLAMKYLKKIAVPVLFLMGSVWAGLSYERAVLFQSEEAIWRDAIHKHSVSTIARHNLGTVLQNKGRISEAELEYRRVLELDPAYVDAHNNLAAILTEQGKPDEAIQHLEIARSLRPHNAATYLNLGIAFAAKNDLNAAVSYFREAVRLEPESWDSRHNLELALRRERSYAAALAPVSATR